MNKPELFGSHGQLNPLGLMASHVTEVSKLTSMGLPKAQFAGFMCIITILKSYFNKKI